MSRTIHPKGEGKVRANHESLGDAIQAVVLHSDVPAKALADAIGVRYGYLLDAANPDRDDTQFQARLIAPLTRASRNAAIVQRIAQDCGGVFVPLDRAEV